MSPRTAFVSRSRAQAVSAVEARNRWKLFLEQARGYARAALRGESFDPHTARAFTGFALHLTAPFPVRMGCAEEAATACRWAARALMGAGLMADRCNLASFLIAGLDFLDRVVAEDFEQRAEFAKRISGAAD